MFGCFTVRLRSHNAANHRQKKAGRGTSDVFRRPSGFALSCTMFSFIREFIDFVQSSKPFTISFLVPATHNYQSCFIPKQPTIHIASRLITALSRSELTLEYLPIIRS